MKPEHDRAISDFSGFTVVEHDGKKDLATASVFLGLIKQALEGAAAEQRKDDGIEPRGRT